MIARRRFAFQVGLAGVLSLVVVGTGSGSRAPLLIAVEGPQSGAQAPNGLDQLRGVRLAVSQLNAQGGLWDGRKVALLAVDDAGEAGRVDERRDARLQDRPDSRAARGRESPAGGKRVGLQTTRGWADEDTGSHGRLDR